MKKIINNHSYLNTLSDRVKKLLVHIDKSSPRFKQWFLNNQTKIISKLRGAREEEDIYDVITELRCAAFLLSFDEVIDLIYEPLLQLQQSPDFNAILINTGNIYFEVRRIRRTFAEAKRDQFKQLFWEKVKTNIHRNFGIGLTINSIKNVQVFQELIDRIDEIITFIDSYLSELSQDIEESIELLLDNYADGLKINISSIPPHRFNNEIRNYGGSFTVPYSGNEYKKFGDIIFEKMYQLLDGEKNVIFIYADNDTHEEYDLMDSITSINDLITEDNEAFVQDKGYASINDFLVKSKRISGILLLTQRHESKLWLNMGSEQPLGEEIKNIFESNS